MTGCCEVVGIQASLVMSLDHVMLADQAELCAIAADGATLVHQDEALGADTLKRLDEAMIEAGVPAFESGIVGLGCELHSTPPLAEPAGEKLTSLACCLLDVLLKGCASPHGVHSMTGLLQCFFSLQKGCFSILYETYAFVRRIPKMTKQSLPTDVQN